MYIVGGLWMLHKNGVCVCVLLARQCELPLLCLLVIMVALLYMQQQEQQQQDQAAAAASAELGTTSPQETTAHRQCELPLLCFLVIMVAPLYMLGCCSKQQQQHQLSWEPPLRRKPQLTDNVSFPCCVSW